jgi:hypothetical protein
VKPGSLPVSSPQSDSCPPSAFTCGPSSNQEVNGNHTLTTLNREALTRRNLTICQNSQQLPTNKEDTNRILPNDATTLSFATWSANGLLTAEGLPETRRKAKKKAIKQLLHDNDVVAVQETHEQSEHWATIKNNLTNPTRFSTLTTPSHATRQVAISSSNSNYTGKRFARKSPKSTLAESSQSGFS